MCESAECGYVSAAGDVDAAGVIAASELGASGIDFWTAELG